MKKLQKNELKVRLTELVEQSQKLKDLYQKMDDDFLGEDIGDVPDEVTDERVNKYYDFIHDDEELDNLYKEFRHNIGDLL